MGSYSSSEKTKAALISAAGELFTEFGIDSVGIRAIAERAGENPGSIHYHFGGKEGLVLAVLRFAMAGWGESQFETCVSGNEPLLETPEGQVELIRKVCRLHLDLVHRSEKPDWCSLLVHRVLVGSNQEVEVMIEEFARPHHEFLKRFLQRLRPDFSADQILVLSVNWMGQIVHPSLAKPVILKLANLEGYSEDFLQALEDHIAENISHALGLPSVPSREEKNEKVTGAEASLASGHPK